MKLTVLGASQSFPNPGGASSSYLISHESTNLLVECGHGSCSRLFAATDPRSLDGVVLSHLHPDHFFDLVPLAYGFRFRYTGGPRIPLWLPPGAISTLQRFFESLSLDSAFLDPHFDVSEYDPAEALTVGTLRVRFAQASHFVPSQAMRFSPVSTGLPAIGYSSDTGPSGSVEELLEGSDLAVVEASLLTYQPSEQTHGHLTGSEAGRLAERAHLGRLLLTHYSDAQGAALVGQAKAEFSGPVELAREGTTYEV